MRRIKVRIHKSRVVEPTDLTEEVEGWLTVPGDVSPAGLEIASEEDVWAGCDPERVRAALRERTGILTERDAEKLIAKIYRCREEGTKPADKS